MQHIEAASHLRSSQFFCLDPRNQQDTLRPFARTTTTLRPDRPSHPYFLPTLRMQKLLLRARDAELHKATEAMLAPAVAPTSSNGRNAQAEAPKPVQLLELFECELTATTAAQASSTTSRRRNVENADKMKPENFLETPLVKANETRPKAAESCRKSLANLLGDHPSLSTPNKEPAKFECSKDEPETLKTA